MKYFITGGIGFIGSHLVSELRKNYNVEVYNLKTQNDILDFQNIKSKMSGADVAIHLAAMIEVAGCESKPTETIKVNTLGTRNVLRAALKNRVKRIIFASSAAVYGKNSNLPLNENLDLAPTSSYALTKIAAERTAMSYFEKYNLPITCLRIVKDRWSIDQRYAPIGQSLSMLGHSTKQSNHQSVDWGNARHFNIYGPRQESKSAYAVAIPIFIEQALLDKELTVYGDGQQTRNFVYIKDIVRAILAAIDKADGEIINLASGRSYSILELAQKIIELTEAKSKIVFEKEQEGDIRYSVADIAKARGLLEYSSAYDIEIGLMEMIR